MVSPLALLREDARSRLQRLRHLQPHVLPGYYAGPVEEHWALLNGVRLWDVGVERIVEITGPDAFEFTNRLTCRDVTKCAVGQGSTS